ncbi:MAG: sensor histidine kinase [Caulobacteraceae bacterium]|nr:sensor histidine kinase [Caulobacteraceae bacterium]
MKLDLGWKSLQARLVVGAVLWVSIGLALSGTAVSTLFRGHVTDQFTHELNDHLTELQSLLVFDQDNRGMLLRPVSDPRFAVPGSGYYWEIWRGGAPILRSPSLEGRNIVAGPGATVQERAKVEHSQEQLVFAQTSAPTGDPRQDMRFVVGADDGNLKRIIAQFERSLTGSLAIVAVGLFGAATAQVWFGLQPLRRLRVALARVRAGQADGLPGDFPSEVQPLVSDLNEVILANREMIQRARAQAGNLAHALRTPLAVMSAEAQRLAEDGRTEAAAAILLECRAMARQIDYQIARARAAASRAGIGTQVAPAAVAGQIFAAVGRLHAERNLIFANEIPPDLTVLCDPDDLHEMLANLVDNAAKWAARQVKVSATSDAGGAASLIVEDDGPGIPISKRLDVFRLGERLDERAAGSGLGLTIVHDLVELYGGTVVLADSDLGGAKAVLKLPN